MMAKQILTGTPKLISRLLGIVTLVWLTVSSPFTLADAREDHLGRYHEGYGSYEADSEKLRMARLAVVGYGAKQGLKSMGVDYQQAKKIFKNLTVHSVTATSSVMIEPERINFLTQHLEGAFMTELSGKADGQIDLSVKIPF